MTKRLRSKYKLNRRLGENIWGRPKSPVNKRDYPPGQHAPGRRRKPSDYGLPLAPTPLPRYLLYSPQNPLLL